MNVSRETIYAALFSLVSGSASFATTSRKLRHWSDVGAEEQPALFQQQLDEDIAQSRGTPANITLHAQLYIYVTTASQQTAPDVVPSQLINPLIDAVDSALAGDDIANFVQTLGGLVSHCWIEGKIETYEGLLGDQAVAIIPVAILVPA